MNPIDNIAEKKAKLLERYIGDKVFIDYQFYRALCINLMSKYTDEELNKIIDDTYNNF